MRAFLRRQVPLIGAVAGGFIVGCFIGVNQGFHGAGIMQSAFVVAGMAGGLVLLWRFLLVLVSLDPDKPRAVTRQNRSAHGYGFFSRRRS